MPTHNLHTHAHSSHVERFKSVIFGVGLLLTVTIPYSLIGSLEPNSQENLGKIHHFCTFFSFDGTKREEILINFKVKSTGCAPYLICGLVSHLNCPISLPSCFSPSFVASDDCALAQLMLRTLNSIFLWLCWEPKY